MKRPETRKPKYNISVEYYALKVCVIIEFFLTAKKVKAAKMSVSQIYQKNIISILFFILIEFSLYK